MGWRLWFWRIRFQRAQRFFTMYLKWESPAYWHSRKCYQHQTPILVYWSRDHEGLVTPWKGKSTQIDFDPLRIRVHLRRVRLRRWWTVLSFSTWPSSSGSVPFPWNFFSEADNATSSSAIHCPYFLKNFSSYWTLKLNVGSWKWSWSVSTAAVYSFRKLSERAYV